MYTKSQLTGVVKRDSDGLVIIFDDTNQDYLDYFAWISDENNVITLVDAFPGEAEALQKETDLVFEASKYYQRAVDGKELYCRVMSEARYDLQHEVITLADFQSLQSDLVETREELFAGQWDVALSVFDQVTMGQELHDIYFDSIRQRIYDYSVMTYTSMSSSKIGGGGIKNPPKP